MCPKCWDGKKTAYSIAHKSLVFLFLCRYASVEQEIAQEKVTQEKVAQREAAQEETVRGDRPQTPPCQTREGLV